MNATNRQIGMLSALPNLFASLVQLKSADVVDKIKSRKKIVTTISAIQYNFQNGVQGTKPFYFVLS